MRNAVLASIAGLSIASVALAGACSSSSGGQGGSGLPDDASVVTPGCLGAPHESCAPYPDGTKCPGSPTVCVACGPGLYTFSPSTCQCASGAWSCAPPAAGSITCSSPVGQYVDPACTVLYPGDASVEDRDASPGLDSSADGSDAGGPVDAGNDAPDDGGVASDAAEDGG